MIKMHSGSGHRGMQLSGVDCLKPRPIAVDNRESAAEVLDRLGDPVPSPLLIRRLDDRQDSRLFSAIDRPIL
ncbi:MAG: hypothetical protein KJO17_12230 [Acidimicrobiia bacterium]|nr:hypothetical protein [Acidimicrobiia bacterium]